MWLIFRLFVAITGLALPVEAQNRSEYAYGPDPSQVLDVYGSNAHSDAPIIVMLHGGAWKIGDKRNPGVWRGKTRHWGAKGYLFVSVNTRLLPEAEPIAQARDLARALAFVQQDASRWGGDPDRLVLMGHSAGGHVAALLAARQDLRMSAGLKRWSGTVLLDSAAVDVERVMKPRPARAYAEAFGTDPNFWKAASPIEYFGPEDGPVLVVCSAIRRRPCEIGRDFAARSGHAELLPVRLSHAAINRELGKSSAYTRAVDSWLSELGLP